MPNRQLIQNSLYRAYPPLSIYHIPLTCNGPRALRCKHRASLSFSRISSAGSMLPDEGIINCPKACR